MSENKRKIEIGDYVIATKRADKLYPITTSGFIGKVIRMSTCTPTYKGKPGSWVKAVRYTSGQLENQFRPLRVFKNLAGFRKLKPGELESTLL